MSDTTVAVTGGTGRLGPTVVRTLQESGYRVVNCSRSGGDSVADAGVRADATDPGEVYGAFATADADAVIHLGMISEPYHDPGHAVYESNAMSTYNVLEAAGALGIDDVVLASSLSALGAGFEPDPVRVEYLPVDEDHPLTPSNPYGLGKQVLEVTADGVARRDDGPRSVASIRFPWMPSDGEMRETFVESDRTLDGLRSSDVFHEARNTLFAYLARQDAADLIRRALEGDFAGHERFWAAAADTNTETSTPELCETVYDDAEARQSFSEHESLISTEKASKMLGWEPERSWRDVS
jgi:nucleoside-diphosphate-sugar epimerase